MGNNYYARKLSAERLRLCYEIAPLRVKRYLQAEIDFVLDRVNPSDRVLELGCGYGRVLQKLIPAAKTVVGIDISYPSLKQAQEITAGYVSCYLLAMDAIKLGFHDGLFDMVVCIQNGISAFNVDQRTLLGEAMRVARCGGMVVFSSYSKRFWRDRLEWFQIQADYGLIGEIDAIATGDGIIVCKDGFRATTVGPDEFFSLTSVFNVVPKITEVDGSSVFCEIVVK
jgi:ubiquinone/menaquinone biosynthesis C-methylase UbiE